MKVYVVFEEDRGMGVQIIDAYVNEEDAQKYAAKSSHLSYQEVELRGTLHIDLEDINC